MFEKWPFSNFHDLNLNWVLDYVKEAKETIASFEEKIKDGFVSKINNKTGDVTLTAGDVGAVPDTTTLTNTVNGKSGNVQLSASDVGAVPSETQIVNNVNGKTGAVTLEAEDIGAVPDTTSLVNSVNGKNGTVTLTAGDINALGANTKYVSSVNGQSGTVTLTGDDIATSASDAQVLSNVLTQMQTEDESLDGRVDSLESASTEHGTAISDIQTKNTEQDEAIKHAQNEVVAGESADTDVSTLDQTTLAEMYNSGNRLIYPPNDNGITKCWFIEKVGDTYTVRTLQAVKAVDWHYSTDANTLELKAGIVYNITFWTGTTARYISMGNATLYPAQNVIGNKAIRVSPYGSGFAERAQAGYNVLVVNATMTTPSTQYDQIVFNFTNRSKKNYSAISTNLVKMTFVCTADCTLTVVDYTPPELIPIATAVNNKSATLNGVVPLYAGDIPLEEDSDVTVAGIGVYLEEYNAEGTTIHAGITIIKNVPVNKTVTNGTTTEFTFSTQSSNDLYGLLAFDGNNVNAFPSPLRVSGFEIHMKFNNWEEGEYVYTSATMIFYSKYNIVRTITIT